MRLNPKKCKEMFVNFMGNPNTIMRPLCIEKPNSRKNFIIQTAWSSHL